MGRPVSPLYQSARVAGGADRARTPSAGYGLHRQRGPGHGRPGGATAFSPARTSGETEHFAAWFRDRGFKTCVQPRHDFEGEGDALRWNDVLFAGYPWRSDKPAHAELAQFFGVEVVSLQLTDARFYHLDTALTIVDERTVALYPPRSPRPAWRPCIDACRGWSRPVRPTPWGTG